MGAEPDQVWQAVHIKLTRLFSERKLNQVRVECAEKRLEHRRKVPGSDPVELSNPERTCKIVDCCGR